MSKYPEKSIVKLSKYPLGGVRGVVTDLSEQPDYPTQYYVEWDDGTYRWHKEPELMWANIDNPAQQYKSWS